MRHGPFLQQAGAAAVDCPPPIDGRRWRIGLAGLWLAACTWLLTARAQAIATLRLPDSDDAMRLLQVRDWLNGQGWFDLRQYRLDPPAGADIHWSRLVDLPLAAVIAPLRPLLGAEIAERVAAALVPLFTLGCAMALLALLARRLIAPAAWWWAPVLLLVAGPPLDMMAPLRIDHHGWQIVALLALLAGLVAGDRRRGGIAAGLAIAASFTIGVEVLPYVALGIAVAALGWLTDAQEGMRLRWLCGTAAVGVLVALFAFVPPAGRFGVVCDALSPGYALPLCAGCGVLAAGAARAGGVRARSGWIVAAGLAAGAALLALGAGMCVVDPYRAVDPAARTLWLDRVSEALPLWRQAPEVFWASLALPLVGIVGAVTMLRMAAGRRRAWAAVLAFATLGLLLALVSTRAAVAAMALALPGAAALGHLGRRWLAERDVMPVRVFGSVALFLCVSAIVPRLLIAAALAEALTAAETRQEVKAEGCMTPAALASLDALPAGTLLGFLDATPALLLHTRHRGLAGPYHRNGRAIADTMRAWAGTPATARTIIARHRIAYVVACGEPAEAQIYDRRAPDGFHARLMRGDTPPWLAPVPMNNGPWKVWRVRRALPPVLPAA